MSNVFQYIDGPSLADVPPDAPYIGPGPLYTWSPDMRAWTSWPLTETVYWRKEMPKTKSSEVEVARDATGWEVARALQVERNELQARISALLRHAGGPALCKGCKQRIWWIHGAETRTAVPFDADGRNHLQTCVDAEEFSKARSFELT